MTSAAPFGNSWPLLEPDGFHKNNTLHFFSCPPPPKKRKVKTGGIYYVVFFALRRLDHTRILGDTVEKIAIDKAGIIKPGVPALVGERCPVELLRVSSRVPLWSTKSPVELIHASMFLRKKRPMIMFEKSAQCPLFSPLPTLVLRTIGHRSARKEQRV